MNKKSLWIYIFGITLIIIGLIKLDTLISMVAILQSVHNLIFFAGAKVIYFF